jgi:hypothetical protein
MQVCRERGCCHEPCLANGKLAVERRTVGSFIKSCVLSHVDCLFIAHIILLQPCALPCQGRVMQSGLAAAGGAEEGGVEKKEPASKARRVNVAVRGADPIPPVQNQEPPGDPNEATGSNDDISKDFSAHYLIKSEPNDYSVDDLAKEPNQTTCWGAIKH